jgi:hypothetical protein
MAAEPLAVSVIALIIKDHNPRSQLAPVQRKIIFNPHKTLIFGILPTQLQHAEFR